MSGHTPGPWTHYNAKLRPQFSVRVNEIHGPNGEVIVQWGGFDAADGKKPEIKANARLIAAAPDLLDLANDIVSNVILAGTEIGQRAQELIAKATGATP